MSVLFSQVCADGERRHEDEPKWAGGKASGNKKTLAVSSGHERERAGAASVPMYNRKRHSRCDVRKWNRSNVTSRVGPPLKLKITFNTIHNCKVCVKLFHTYLPLKFYWYSLYAKKRETHFTNAVVFNSQSQIPTGE